MNLKVLDLCMFSFRSVLQHVRFDVNWSYAGIDRPFTKTDFFYDIDYAIRCAKNDEKKSELLFLKIFRIYWEEDTRDEVIGYLGQVVCVLNLSTIEMDRPILLDCLRYMVKEADSYWTWNCPIIQGVTGWNHTSINENAVADKILNALKGKGLY